MSLDLEPYIYRPHPIYRLPSREDAAVACQTAEGEKEFRDAMLNELGGRGPDKETFAELIGEVVQEYVGEIPSIEIIGVRDQTSCRGTERRRVIDIFKNWWTNWWTAKTDCRPMSSSHRFTTANKGPNSTLKFDVNYSWSPSEARGCGFAPRRAYHFS